MEINRGGDERIGEFERRTEEGTKGRKDGGKGNRKSSWVVGGLGKRERKKETNIGTIRVALRGNPSPPNIFNGKVAGEGATGKVIKAEGHL